MRYRSSFKEKLCQHMILVVDPTTMEFNWKGLTAYSEGIRPPLSFKLIWMRPTVPCRLCENLKELIAKAERIVRDDSGRAEPSIIGNLGPQEEERSSAPNSSLPDETAIPMPPEQGVAKKKKKKAIAKNVKGSSVGALLVCSLKSSKSPPSRGFQSPFGSLSIKDVKVESAILRKRLRESKDDCRRANDLFYESLLKRKEFEEEIHGLKQSLVMASADSLKSGSE
ncbi:hypothetical protein COCNU_scaffold001554G000010 [Cocos nucifera]|nr:hypothetical protein [Cocos nucifera]